MARQKPKSERVAKMVVGQLGRLADGEARRLPKKQTIPPTQQFVDYMQGRHLDKLADGTVTPEQYSRYATKMQKLGASLVRRHEEVNNAT